MFDLGEIDVEEIATALADQTDYEHRWLIDPRTGQVSYWTSDTGIDVQHPVELDELDLIPIDPLPPYVWFQDMANFADGVSDRAARRRLSQSLQGKAPFRRFKSQIYEHHPELISAWHALRDARAQRRAVEWLRERGLIETTPLNSSRPTTQIPASLEASPPEDSTERPGCRRGRGTSYRRLRTHP